MYTFTKNKKMPCGHNIYIKYIYSKLKTKPIVSNETSFIDFLKVYHLIYHPVTSCFQHKRILWKIIVIYSYRYQQPTSKQGTSKKVLEKFTLKISLHKLNFNRLFICQTKSMKIKWSVTYLIIKSNFRNGFI